MSLKFTTAKQVIVSTLAAVSLLAIGFMASGPFSPAQVQAAPSDEPSPPKKPSTKKKKKKKNQSKKDKTPKTKSNFSSESSGLWDTDDASSIPDLVPARALIEEDDYHGAIAQLNALNRPDDANVLNMLGFSHRKLGLIDAGIAYYLRALENNPRHKGVHEYLGEAYLQKDDIGKARVLLRKLGLICGTSCNEYSELASAIAQYEERHKL